MSLELEIDLTDGYKMRKYQDGCLCCSNTRYVLVDDEGVETDAWGGEHDPDSLDIVLEELVHKITQECK